MNEITPKEIKLSSIRPILSRTDLTGKIKSCNSYFVEISGYTEAELIGKAHNIIRHKDMPKIIFKLMWARLKKNEDILAIVKNRSKSGNYYWVTTMFETKYHPFEKTPESYLALRKAAPEKAVKAIEPLYAELCKIEEEHGIEASEEYLMEILRQKNKTYDEYIEDIVHYKGLMATLFNSMRKVFVS